MHFKWQAINAFFIGTWLACILPPAAGQALTEQEVNALVSASPDAQKYPDCDAVILYEKQEFILEESHGLCERFHRMVKIFNEVGRNRFSDPCFSFNTTTQSFEVVKARTWTAERGWVDLPENAVNRVTPRSVDRCPAYCTLQDVVISHTALEENCVIELVVEKKTAPRFLAPRHLWGEIQFNHTDPILKKELTITIPNDTRFQWEAVPRSFTPRIEKKKSMRLFTWISADNEALPQEKHAPSGRMRSKRVSFSTCCSWEALSSFFRERGKEALPLGETLSQKTGELLENKPEARDRIAALHGFIRERFKLVNVDIAPFDYRFRRLSEILDGRYLDRWTASVLLSEMLGKAGVETQLCLKAEKGAVSRKAPSMEPFSDLLVACEIKTDAGATRKVYLDPSRPINTQGNGVPNAVLLNVQSGSLVETDPRKMSLALTGKLAMSKGGTVSGEVRIDTMNLPVFSPFQSGKEKKQKAASLVSAFFKKASIKKCEIESKESARSITCTVSFTSDGMIEEKQGILFCVLPRSFFFPSHFDVPLAQEKRKTVLQLPACMRQDINFSLTVPPNWKCLYEPEKVTLSAHAGSLQMNCLVKDGTIEFERHLSLPKHKVTPGEYQQFRKMLITSELENHRTILFKK